VTSATVERWKQAVETELGEDQALFSFGGNRSPSG
jgi:hypothetical protein